MPLGVVGAGEDGQLRGRPDLRVVLADGQEARGVAGALTDAGGPVGELRPGPLEAVIAMAKSTRSEENGANTVEESWEMSSEAGDKLRFAATFTRGIGVRAHVEQKIHAAVKPSFHRIYKIDQVTQVAHSTADESRRARKVEVAASGPQLGKLFDGTEQLVAVMSVPAYYRQVFLPE